MATPTLLNSASSSLLPNNVTEPIFKQASEESAVMRLARRVPLSMDANTVVPVPMDVPAAGWVAEGGAKPVSTVSAGVKQMTAKKVALLMPVSEEVVRTNAAGLYEQLRQDAPTAIARAFDHAAIHGKDLRTGAAGPFTEYLKMTTNSVELGTKNQASGGMYGDLVQGELNVVNQGYDFTGIAADPKLKPLLKLQVDSTGRPIWVDDPQMGLNGGTLIGYPAYFNRGVSGAYVRSGNKIQVLTITGSPAGGTFTITDQQGHTYSPAYNATGATLQTNLRLWGGIYAEIGVTGSAGGPYTITFPTTGATLFVSGAGLTGGTNPAATIAQSNAASTSLRAIGGDFTQCAYGVGMDITVRVSNEASYVDEAGVTHSAFQENLVLLLIEAYYGFVMGNPLAFNAYIDAV